VKSIVSSLEMKTIAEDDKGIELEIPAYRVDVYRPCDVVEDILRIYGYNNVEIGTQMKSSLVIKGEADESHKLENIIGEQLAGSGFNEILNNSLSRAAYYEDNNSFKADTCVRVMNPLSADLSVMRQTLLYGGLESILRNVNRKQANLKLFEFGNCYAFDKEKQNEEQPIKAYSEEYHLGLWITGKRVERSWMTKDEPFTFYDLKAYVENILARLGVKEGLMVKTKSQLDIFSNGIRIEQRGGKTLVEMGVLAKKTLKKADIDSDVFYAELNWTQLMKAIRKNVVEYKEISKYPAVSRDLALLLDKQVEFSAIEDIAKQTEKKLLKKVELFDVYEGKNLPEGKKSYAVNFILQDEEKTLNDKQIDAIMQKLVANLKSKLGAELR